MGFSHQRCLVAMDDTLYHMANTAFDRMLQDPMRCCLAQLAGRRVRTVEVVVELVGRKPAAVVRTAFAVLAFDDTGCIDAARLRKQQCARIEHTLAPVFVAPQRDEKVIDAGGRFIAQGGTWTPSPALARASDDAALGRQECPPLDAGGRNA
jgi:hypothetical protein